MYIIERRKRQPLSTEPSETIPTPETKSEIKTISEQDRFFMECDLTKHYFFETVREFETTVKHDYRTNDTDSNIEKSVEIVATNFINILSEIYMDEAIYWQRIFSSCSRTNSCIDCIITSEDFLHRQNEAFKTFVDFFSFFYSYYGYEDDEVAIFKKTVRANQDFIDEIIKIKKDIRKICLRDSVCIKKKMFRILERMHSFVQSVDNGIDDAISNMKRSADVADTKKLFRTKHPHISVNEMKTKDIVDLVNSTDTNNLLRDIQESFELREEEMRS